jgi:hypothetical protein
MSVSLIPYFHKKNAVDGPACNSFSVDWSSGPYAMGYALPPAVFVLKFRI